MRTIPPPNHPLMLDSRATTVACARVHQALDEILPLRTVPRTGSIAAAWVDEVLVVSASGACGTDLAALLIASLLAEPEVVT
jgi:hypothetical protein